MEEQKAYVGKIIYSDDGRMKKERFKCGFCGWEMPFDVVELYCTMCGRVIDWTDYTDELRKATADNPYFKLVNETLKMIDEKHIPKELIDVGYWMACPLCGASDLYEGEEECRHCKQKIMFGLDLGE